MAGLSRAASSERGLELPRLLVVYSDLTVLSTSEELHAVWLVISGQELVGLVVDAVQQLARSGVEVEQGALGVGRDQHVLGNTWGSEWSPSTEAT